MIGRLNQWKWIKKIFFWRFVSDERENVSSPDIKKRKEEIHV